MSISDDRIRLEVDFPAIDVADLMAPCECMERRALIDALWPKLTVEPIKALVSYFDGRDWVRQEGVIVTTPQPDCDFCRNTGFRITAKGRNLLEWLERYASDFLDEAFVRRQKDETAEEEQAI